MNDYKYLYETHLHTSHGSLCARNGGYEMAKAAHEYGYAGIFVTEHNWYGNTAIPGWLPWEEWIDEFTKGYKDACRYAEGKDFDVFWAYESCYEGTEFLIYGISPEWLKAHPEMKNAPIPIQHYLVQQAGGMVVHAHPYREEPYIPEIRLFPDYVDAVEGINATHSNHKSVHHFDPEFDTKAIAYAKKHNLPMTAGSDVHTTTMFGGGVLLKDKIHSVEEYIQAIKAGDYRLTNGDVVYDRFGERI